VREWVIWGRNPVLEALRSGRSLEKIYLAHDTSPPKEILRLAKERGVKVQKVSRRRVEELARTKKTQGVVALLSPVEYVPPEVIFEEAVRENSFFLALDHITDPQNVGNLLRTCEVLGGVGAVMPKDRSAPVNETVAKASSGALFHLRISKVASLSKTLKSFKDAGGWVVAVEKGGRDIRDVEIPVPCALVLGSEDGGVSEAVLKVSDLVVTIPMWGKVTSLNVGSAGAIAMWETVKSLRR
jgi:23S rRNA (guanosine2251-2'-O)-methyltransferase